jgi:hypothetical protein
VAIFALRGVAGAAPADDLQTGCCTGHGGPAGCDAETHKVLCADGKKSKSCEC